MSAYIAIALEIAKKLFLGWVSTAEGFNFDWNAVIATVRIGVLVGLAYVVVQQLGLSGILALTAIVALTSAGEFIRRFFKDYTEELF